MKILPCKNVLVVMLACTALTVLWSQALGQKAAEPGLWSENGLPYIRNFTPREYGGFIQNWSVLQDQRGLVYVANNDGLLEYDGTNWRMYTDQGKLRSLRSLAIDSAGVIYVGLAADFGYLEPDSVQGWRLVSLLSNVDSIYHEFNDVWSTLVLQDAIYFMTPSYLFRWSKEELKVIHPKTRFHTGFVVGENLYLRQHGFGLTRLVGDSLMLVPDGEAFANKRVYFMARRDEALVIGTDEHGFYLHDGQALHPFPTSADRLMNESKVYCGIPLQNGYYALGTRRAGLFVMDYSGNIVQHLSTADGLNDDSVWFVNTDHQGGVWLALNNGIARVETPAPFSFFGKQNGLEGTIEKVYRHNNTLYAATSLGIQYLAVDRNVGLPVANFKPVSGIEEYTWTFLTVGNQLLAGTTSGIHVVKGTTAISLRNSWSSVFSLTESRKHPGRIYVGHRNGIGLLERISGEWQATGSVANYTEKVYYVMEDPQGVLWLETDRSGVARIRPHDSGRLPNGDLPAQVTHFDTSNGLPYDRVFPHLLAGELRFSTPRGMWKLDTLRNRFLPDSTISLSGYWDFLGGEDDQGRLWLSCAAQYGQPVQIGFWAPDEDGSYGWHPEPFLRLRDIMSVTGIYPEQNGTVWFTTSEGLFRYAPLFNRDRQKPYTSLIRRVEVNEDSTLFTGNGGLLLPVLDYNANTILFQFAAPSFDAGAVTQFQHRLEGFSDEWSHWGFETRKEYTNLSEGEYVFKVRAQNVYGQLSEEAIFAFTIKAPWYRSWWAYLTYFLVFVALLSGLFGFAMDRATRREQEKAKLREAEIFSQKNIELNAKNKELQFVLKKLQTAQDSLIDSESRFRAVAESANDAIVTSDITGLITFWNKHAETVFGYSKKEAQGQPVTMLMPEKYHKAHREGLENFLRTGKGRIMGQPVELEAIRKDGTRFPIELTLAAWETHDGQFVTGILRDITKRKQEQAELEKTQVRLFQSEKLASLGKLTAGIVHEINTPLGAIKSNADVNERCIARLDTALKKARTSTGTTSDDDYEKLVMLLKENSRITTTASERIAKILNSLRNFITLDKAEYQQVDLHENINSALALIEHEIKDQITVVKEYGEIPPVGCYPGEINQVFMNLMTNAVQAIKGKGTITIRTLEEDGNVHVQITDTGVGISPERMDALFEPGFTRKDSRVKAGLGLFTSCNFVQKHNGRIAVQSEIGSGSTFTVILPVNLRETPGAAQARESERQQQSKEKSNA